MGRKIPAKKHHGVKDPEKQAERRNAKIKLKINETPENIEEQEIPKKLKNLFKKPHKKRGLDDPSLELILLNNKDPTSKIQLRPVKKTPKIKRRPEETDRDLLWRTEVVTRDYMKQKRFEDKYDVDVEKDYKTGAVQIKKRVPFVEDQVNTEPKNKWEKKKLKKMEKIRLEQEERKRLKKEKFKEKKLYKKNKGKKMDEFSVLKQDKIEFGEVAEQPPTLTAKPRKSKSLDMPGNRNLLLKNMVPDQPSSNLSGKRKDLSALDRQKLEEERVRVVELYREMQKLKNANRA